MAYPLSMFLKMTLVVFGISILLLILFGVDINGSSVFSVFISSAIIGLLAALFQMTLNRRNHMPSLEDSETILLSELSVHGTAFKDAGGWLLLTNQSLRFKSHSFSTRKREIDLPLTDISNVEQSGKNHILIIANNGKQERFSVKSVSQWSDAIKHEINQV